MILWVVLYLIFGVVAAIFWATYEAEHINETESYIDHYDYAMGGRIPEADEAEKEAEKHNRNWHALKPLTVALLPFMVYMASLLDPVPAGKHLVLAVVFCGAFWIVFNPLIALFTDEKANYLSDKGVDGVLLWLRNATEMPAWSWQIIITLQIIGIIELFV